MIALLVMIGCDGGDQSEFDEQSDIAYGAGCDAGQVDGTVAGADDGKACRVRADVPNDTARKAMLEYCGGKKDVDSDQPCYWWEIGYLDCWRAAYDMTYPVGWDRGDCDPDSAS